MLSFVSVGLLFVFGTAFCLEKKIVLHSDADILQRILHLEQEIQALKSENAVLKSQKGTASVYVRWGRNVCSTNGTTLVYKGYMAGGYYAQTGGGGDYQCLPHDVQWNYNNTAAGSGYAQLFGTEYEMDSNTIGSGAYQNDAPCSVCRTQRSTSLMIPGRTSCFPGWTLEYAGYLAANWIGSGSSTSNFVCLDGHPEVLDGSATNDDQAVLHNVVSKCGSLPCPPYVDGRELACIVCSK